ncbi:carbon catabolite repressor protein 4, putative [Plasmodium reichenowi]|uniref:Carbon catabolite repressor protein 4, putative n=1 Tax=Plasmodium reichenowi TaxID=5854 RepID=A0A060RRL0_PLARE|nr:carbon catabolite repressor protein 4, putative [Plasmodium reichenowi]
MFKGNKIRVGTINIFNSACYTIKEKLSLYPFEYNYNIDRKNLLYKHFFYNKLDIICLQEVDFFMINDLKKKFFDHDFILHTPEHVNTKSPKSNNCCIAYKKCFKLIGEKQFDTEISVIKNLIKYSSESGCEIQDAFIRELSKRKSIANMVILELSKQTYLGICNCHIHWNPLYPDIKLYHAYLIIRDFYEFIQNTFQDIPFIPLLLIGDFNSTPHIDHKKEDGIIQASGVYELITTGRISKNHAHHPARLRKSEAFYSYPELKIPPFKSVFKEINGKEPEFTNKTPSFEGCIDYIFYKELIPTSTETIPRNLKDIKMLPNEHFPSDHIMLTSEFFIV